MAEMQASLINESDEDVITPVCQMLLLAALDDPGVEGPQVFELARLECIRPYKPWICTEKYIGKTCVTYLFYF